MGNEHKAGEKKNRNGKHGDMKGDYRRKMRGK